MWDPPWRDKLVSPQTTNNKPQTNKMRVQVKDFMSAPVTTAVGESRVREVRMLMKNKNIHAIPIVRHEKQLPNNQVTIRGIITSSDLDERVEDNATMEEVMTQNVHISHQDSSAQAAAKMMLKHKVHHIVVMDDGRIVGMISSTDFVKLVAEHVLD